MLMSEYAAGLAAPACQSTAISFDRRVIAP